MSFWLTTMLLKMSNNLFHIKPSSLCDKMHIYNKIPSEESIPFAHSSKDD